MFATVVAPKEYVAPPQNRCIVRVKGMDRVAVWHNSCGMIKVRFYSSNMADCRDVDNKPPRAINVIDAERFLAGYAIYA